MRRAAIANGWGSIMHRRPARRFCRAGRSTCSKGVPRDAIPCQGAGGETRCRGLGRNAKPDAVICESKQANRPQGDEASGDSEWMGFYNAQTTRSAILPGGSFNLLINRTEPISRAPIAPVALLLDALPHEASGGEAPMPARPAVALPLSRLRCGNGFAAG